MDPRSKEIDAMFMAEAMKEAIKASRRGEVPVGAVIVREGVVVAKGYNRREADLDPSSHAEMTAIRRASKRLKSWRLSGSTLYVTLEPCPMCMGAILQARIPRLVFAAFDPKAGACGSLYDLSDDKRLNHRVHVSTGILEDESKAMLKGFFRTLRAKKKGKG